MGARQEMRASGASMAAAGIVIRRMRTLIRRVIRSLGRRVANRNPFAARELPVGARPTSVATPDRTLVFCTAFVPGDGDPYYTWNVRYRIWIEAVRRLGIRVDQILLVDDGSDALPDWPDVTIVHEGEDLQCDAPVVLYHFARHLGRPSMLDFPGWVRSFFFASRYSEANGFPKIVFLEADDPENWSLHDRYHDIVREFKDMTLESFGLPRLWDLYPTFSSERIIASENVFNKSLFRGKAASAPTLATAAPAS